MKRSHTTQELLNYFDEKDTRVREVPYTIDQQLLNVAAEQIDDADQRGKREVAAGFFSTAPANIDNRGIYHEVRIPTTFELPAEGDTPPTIEADFDGSNVWVELVPYDDRLPVPAAVEFDPDVQPIAAADLRILNMTGSGDGIGDVWDIQTVAPGALLLGNVLSFWLEGLYDRAVLVDILIEGERHPRPAWISERKTETEIVRISSNGLSQSKFPWSVINKITVRNLPTNSRLQAWILPAEMPLSLDSDRPFIHPGYRDRLFLRYWEVENEHGLLTERYFSGNFGGYEYVNSYSTPEDLVGLAVEPHTWGMWVAAGTRLYYVDRREPMPDKLDAPALVREPFYALTLSYDEDNHGRNRAAFIRPMVLTQAPQGVEFRYSVEDPGGNHFVLTPDGSLVSYNASVGWKIGIPEAVRLAFPDAGTYVITLETLDRHGIISKDSALYLNGAMAVTSFDLSDTVSEIKGLAFDYLGRLWIWTGTHLIPLRAKYHGYVIDHDTRTAYITEPAEQVRFS